jgi:HYDIN/CFA65/VesB family protein
MIVLSGTGVGSSQVLDVPPASLAFGNVDVNASSTQEITVKNGGNSNLSISGDSVEGTGLSATGLNGGTTLTPGQTAVLEVEFVPKTAGTVTGSITITSNASNGGSFTIPVTGTGVTAAHVVALHWQASTSTGGIGYYVYRLSVPGGPFSKLVGSAMAETTYSDSSVTALNSNGTESAYSNQAATTAPSPCSWNEHELPASAVARAFRSGAR